MLATLLDTDVAEPARPPAPWRARRAPSRSELLRDEVSRRVRAAVGAGRALGQAVVDPVGGLQQVGAAASGLWKLARTGLSQAPAVSINRPIGPHRQVSWLALDLEQLKAIKRRLGGTINDVVLTIVSGALGTVLRTRGDLPQGGTLRAAVPVSVRTADELDAPGNRVSVWLCPLPVSERNPLRRLATIRATTEELKRGQHAAGGAVLAEVANWAGGAMVEAAAKVINATRIYNLIVTNVPGPSFPLYLAGARMTEAYPHLPLFEQQGLGIALLSYMGRLYVGMASDWGLGDMLAEVRDRVEAGFLELVQIAGIAGTPTRVIEHDGWDHTAVA
jgi:WS/DGAT/MGAT family acyltransferase